MTTTHHSAPRDISAASRALFNRTDALLVTSAGEEPILATRYEVDEEFDVDVLVITTESGDHAYRIEDGVVTVRMPMTTFAAIRAMQESNS